MIGVSAAAPPRTPGVSVGDSFTYGNVSFNWFSNQPNATPPSNFTRINETQSFTVTIENIVDTNVTFSLQYNFKNGTVRTETDWIDINSGDSSNFTLILIAGNLSPPDSIYNGTTYQDLTINETFQRAYPYMVRDTNHLNVWQHPPYLNWSMNLFWDKETGALVELHISTNSTMVYTTNFSVSLDMLASNKWTVVPEFVGLPQTLFLLATFTIVIVALKRKLETIKNA